VQFSDGFETVFALAAAVNNVTHLRVSETRTDTIQLRVVSVAGRSILHGSVATVPLRFLSAVDGIVLICEGSERPKTGERVRAAGDEGNGLVVVDVVERLPQFTNTPAHCFGLRLRCADVPWPPNTLLDILSGSTIPEKGMFSDPLPWDAKR